MPQSWRLFITSSWWSSLRALTMCVHREQAAHLLDSTELHHLVEEALAILRR